MSGLGGRYWEQEQWNAPATRSGVPVSLASVETLCECGHRMRNHAGEGPCIAYMGHSSGSACKCRQFRPAALSPSSKGRPR